MSELLALGISYRTAPVALRERLAFTPTGASAFAKLTLESPEVHEVVVLSTCNRTRSISWWATPCGPRATC